MLGAFGSLRAVKRINRLSEEHPWLGNASVRLDAAFNNPDLQPTNLFIEYLQTKASDTVRNTIAEQHANHLEAYATANDTAAALREAIVQLVESYAPLMVLFTKVTHKNNFQGMFENAKKLLPLYFKQFDDPDRIDSEILCEMSTKMQRHGFDFLLTFKFKEAFDGQDDPDAMEQLLISACRHHSVVMQQMLGQATEADVSRQRDISHETQQNFFEGQMGLLIDMV